MAEEEERFTTYKGQRYRVPADVAYTQEGVAQAYRDGRLLPAEPPSLPDVREPLQRGLGVASGILHKAHAETQRGLEAGGAVPPWAASLINVIPPDIAGLAGALAPLWVGGGAISGPLKRIATAGLTGGLVQQLESDDPRAAVRRSAEIAGGQAGGEALATPFRLFANARTAGHIKGELASDLASREKQIALEKANYAAARESERTGQEAQLRAARKAHATRVTDIDVKRVAEADRIREARAQFQEREQGRKQAHETVVAGRERMQDQSQRAWEQAAASRVVEDFKTTAPGFADFPATEAGLADIVWGRGREALGERFDPVMREIVDRAHGQTINILDKDLAALKLKPKDWVDRTDLGRGVREGITDAAQVAEAIVGKSKKLPDVYRRVVEALDAKNLGDPAARAEYKSGMALIEFGRKSKMISAKPLEPQFNADLAREMLAAPPSNALRTRDAGDIFRGPIAGATRIGKPPELPEVPPFVSNVFRRPPRTPGLAKPVWIPPDMPPRMPKTPSAIEPSMPPTLRDRGIVERTIPKISGWHAGLAAEAPFALAGHHGYGLPFIGGVLGSAALGGRPVVTQAPNPAVVEALLRSAPSLVSAYLQQFKRPSP